MADFKDLTGQKFRRLAVIDISKKCGLESVKEFVGKELTVIDKFR